MNIDITNFFIDVSNGWFWFSNLACNWVRWFKVTIFINLTYWIVTLRYDLISLTVFCLDNIRLFTFLSSVIWCIVWWVWCVLTWFLKFFTLFIHISDNNFTFWFFFQLVDVGDILIFFSYFTSCWIWWCKVSFIINFTYCVVTRWNQFISLTVFFDFFWTVVYNCIVGLINWLIFFISYIFLDGLAFCILIMHVNISFNIRLDKVVVHISWWFKVTWNWVVVWEWSETFQLCISNASIWLSYLRFCNNISITPSNQVPRVIPLTSWWKWWIWSTCKWFVKCFSNLCFVMS